MKSKIKVCFVALKAYPLFNEACRSVFGGAEVDLYLLATELGKDESYSVQCVVGDYGQDGMESIENVALLRSVDVRKPASILVGILRLWRALAAANAAIYIQEACSLETVLIASFCLLKRRRFVYRTASSREVDGRYMRSHPFRGRLVRWAFRKASFFIVQNDQDSINAERTVGRSSHVIRNGCRIRESSLEQKEGIVWVGRSVSTKRPDLFLDLARRLPEYRFTMICQQASGDRSYAELVRDAQSIENLEFIARVGYSESEVYFKQSKLLVNTSDSEGFPNAFLQACQNGTGILSMTVDPDGFLARNGCGRCADGNMDRFTEMAKELMDADRAEALGKQGIGYVRKHHDIQMIVRQYDELFRKG